MVYWKDKSDVGGGLDYAVFETEDGAACEE